MKRINVGLVGLGRLGKEYAHMLRYKIPQAELVSVCSISDEELSYARETLGIKQTFKNYEKMLKSVQMDCVYIISSTSLHADHMIQALEHGLHVFCEKPLALSVEECRRVEKVAASFPDKTAIVGFVRRFDPSYKYAKEKIEEGVIGKPFHVKSQTVDKDTVAAWQIQFAKKSGGIFHDFNVHDIDLARWYLGSEINSVWSIGGAYKHKAFADQGDADNVTTQCLFDNGSIATISASRIAAHGHDTYTEIIGTEGTLRVGRPSTKNLVEIYDNAGMRKEGMTTFWERFNEAFYLMTKDFIDCLVTNRKPEISLNDATQATRVAAAFSASYDKGQIVRIES